MLVCQMGLKDPMGLKWLIHDPTVTPQFPYPRDYENFMFVGMDMSLIILTCLRRGYSRIKT